MRTLKKYWENPHYTVGLVLFSFMTAVLGFHLGVETWQTTTLNKHALLDVVLIGEVALACKKAIHEGGHFPVRYIPVFVITALGFSVMISKQDMTVAMFVAQVLALAGLSFVYMQLNSLHRKAVQEERREEAHRSAEQ